MTLKNDVSEFLKSGDIEKGDIVLLHSNITKLYKNLKKKHKFHLQDILDIFIEYVGHKGTLIFPTFNFDFCEGRMFSAKDTPSQMGTFSELARKKADLNRTWHPVYSFVFFGNIPLEEIKRQNYSAYGKKSIFNWITESDGKIAIINLPDQKSMTYYHHVEEIMNVNWRFQKNFVGDYINFSKVKKTINAKIFVRKINLGVKTDVNEMEKILWSKKLYKTKNTKSIYDCRSIRVKLLKNEVLKIIKSNKAEGVLYKKDV
tara:strand:+ start:22883 stop:23659 length:777 start_codon:yes stop_codon:yes gene_type:complete